MANRGLFETMRLGVVVSLVTLLGTSLVVLVSLRANKLRANSNEVAVAKTIPNDVKKIEQVVGQYAAQKNGYRLPEFDSANPPPWWPKNASSYLTPGVRYVIEKSVVNRPVDEITPGTIVMRAYGRPVSAAFGTKDKPLEIRMEMGSFLANNRPK